MPKKNSWKTILLDDVPHFHEIHRRLSASLKFLHELKERSGDDKNKILFTVLEDDLLDLLLECETYFELREDQLPNIDHSSFISRVETISEEVSQAATTFKAKA